MLQQSDIDGLVDQLDAAANQGVAIRPPAARYPDLSLIDAYRIQEAWVARHLARGRRRVGYKLGLTTTAAQRNLGIDRPIYGVLYADGETPNGGRLATGGLIAPRAEPELAFTMRAPLAGQVSAAEALDAIAHAAPALEIIDNRVLAKDPETGRARCALDIIADGGGALGFIISEQRFDPRTVAMAAIDVTICVGDNCQTGRFDAVFGSPEKALVELARELARRGEGLAAGDVVLTGSPLGPVALAAGDHLVADFGALGKIEVTAQ